MSQHRAQHFETAARIVADVVRRFQQNPFPPPVLLNINVPDIPFDQLKGQRVTRLGKRHKAEPVVKSINPRGEAVYWVGAAGAAADAGDGTDFHAIEQGMASITPLQIDLTQFAQLDGLKSWLAP
jgi:5'-nucleotidase